MKFTADEAHWTERGLTKPSGVDADGSFELIADRFASRRTPNNAGESGNVAEADGKIDRDFGDLTRAKWQTEREVARRRTAIFQRQCCLKR